MHGEALRGDDAAQAREEPRQRPGDVEIRAAEAGVVQRIQKRRPVHLHDRHQRARLRTRLREVQRLVVDREAPLDLLACRRPVVVERVGERRERLLEPALVQQRPVGVGTLDDQKRVVELLAEIVVLAETPRQKLEREGADRLVRMRRAEKQRLARAVADRQQLERPSFERRTDRLQRDELRKPPCELARARRKLGHRHELRVSRDV